MGDQIDQQAANKATQIGQARDIHLHKQARPGFYIKTRNWSFALVLCSALLVLVSINDMIWSTINSDNFTPTSTIAIVFVTVTAKVTAISSLPTNTFTPPPALTWTPTFTPESPPTWTPTFTPPPASIWTPTFTPMPPPTWTPIIVIELSTPTPFSLPTWTPTFTPESPPTWTPTFTPPPAPTWTPTPTPEPPTLTPTPSPSPTSTLIVATASPSPTSTSTSCDDVNLPGIYVYNATNFQGSCIIVIKDIGDLDSTSIGSNGLRSLIISGPFCIKMYQSRWFEGNYDEFYETDNDLTDNPLGGQYSSIQLCQ